MIPLADAATSFTFGLLVTFGGIGVLVHGLIFYIIALVAGERVQNRKILSRSSKE